MSSTFIQNIGFTKHRKYLFESEDAVSFSLPSCELLRVQAQAHFLPPEANKNHCMNLLFGSILNARGWLSLGQVRFHGVISCNACAVSLRPSLKSYVLDRWFTERREEQPWVGVRRADREPHPQRHHRAGRHHLLASREGHEQLGEERLSHRRVPEVPALDAQRF